MQKQYKLINTQMIHVRHLTLKIHKIFNMKLVKNVSFIPTQFQTLMEITTIRLQIQMNQRKSLRNNQRKNQRKNKRTNKRKNKRKNQRKKNQHNGQKEDGTITMTMDFVKQEWVPMTLSLANASKFFHIGESGKG